MSSLKQAMMVWFVSHKPVFSAAYIPQRVLTFLRREPNCFVVLLLLLFPTDIHKLVIVPTCGSLCKLLLGPNCAVPAERKTKHVARPEARCFVGDRPLSDRKRGRVAASH